VSQLLTETLGGAFESKYDLGMIAATKGALNMVRQIILLKEQSKDLKSQGPNPWLHWHGL
jgi:hypothetical protein